MTPIVAMTGDSERAYKTCLERLRKVDRITEYIDRYENAGLFRRFLWSLTPGNHYDLEARAAKQIIQERADSSRRLNRWLRSIGPGKIN
jgi:hypothetical protein